MALGLEVGRDGEPELDVELIESGLLLKPPGGGAVAEVIPDRLATHPTTKELLLLVRDHGPVPTGVIAAALGRTTQATSYALGQGIERGWTQRHITGWEVTDPVREWFAHIPARDWGVEPLTSSRRSWGKMPRFVLDALGSEELTSVEVAARVDMDRSQVHGILKRLAREGIVTSDGGRPVRWRRA